MTAISSIQNKVYMVQAKSEVNKHVEEVFWITFLRYRIEFDYMFNALCYHFCDYIHFKWFPQKIKSGFRFMEYKFDL